MDGYDEEVVWLQEPPNESSSDVAQAVRNLGWSLLACYFYLQGKTPIHGRSLCCYSETPCPGTSTYLQEAVASEHGYLRS